MLQRRVTPAKKYLRRTLQIVALVGTLLICILALALIVSQTPWFKDWLRKFVVRQAAQYVNGTLSIGSLGGNLFTGVQLGDIAVDVNGEHVLTLKNVEVKYSIGELMAQAELQGSDGHGVIRLLPYARRIRAGGINLHPQIRVIQDRPAWSPSRQTFS